VPSNLPLAPDCSGDKIEWEQIHRGLYRNYHTSNILIQTTEKIKKECEIKYVIKVSSAGWVRKGTRNKYL
jgi:hypothetical protein